MFKGKVDWSFFSRQGLCYHLFPGWTARNPYNQSSGTLGGEKSPGFSAPMPASPDQRAKLPEVRSPSLGLLEQQGVSAFREMALVCAFSRGECSSEF